MSQRRDFPLGAILTGTTGIMLCEGGFDQFYELATHMAGGPVWTHELVALAPIIAADLHRQHPDLPTTAPELTESTFRVWVAEQKAIYGETRSIEPIPDYGCTKGPLETLAEMVGDKPIIPVVTGRP